MSLVPDRAPVLGVCSWSLQPATPQDLARRAFACGVSNLQLALGPLRDGAWNEREACSVLADAGLTLVSGMASMVGEDYSSLESIRESGGVRPDATWPANLEHALREAELAARLGMSLVTFHAGFLPETIGDPERARMLERLRRLVDVYADQGVRVAFETGQETAETLLGVLDELQRPDAGVNFDPANMILYDMGDPVTALRELAPRVAQIHVKDATRTTTPGEWGAEVPVGKGEVDWTAFFDVVRERELSCDLMIEREAGAQRVLDINTARQHVQPLWSFAGVGS
jgi:L-ribulose-5-phosphate 3-epimerase